ncbi:MAG: 16S rRNA (guanine(527)-N(7))-methyltransferase RsmG [Bacteroidales bacterium]|nr:16S rRNA (guanine(527)-N(7))-methyltransferase RsmG [Bacteroidales bacterium]
MTADQFIQFAKEKFPELTTEMEARFRQLEPLYNEWNTKINVISRKDIGSLYIRHVAHSLAIAGYLKAERPEIFASFRDGVDNGKAVSVLDLGTGGGFPGIPLAILFPRTNFTLCDSVGKKVKVAREVAAAIGLKNVTFVNARAESLEEKFDYVVSRAVTALDNFYPWVDGKYSGSIFYLKGGDFAEELCRMMSAARLNPGSVRTWKLQNWLDDEVFEDKFVIDIP